MFVVSKIFDLLGRPPALVVLVLLVGTALLFTRRWRAGRGGLAALSAVLLVLAVFPVGPWLAAPLENRFPVPAEPAHVDGIVVLGGAVDPALSDARGRAAVGGAAERLFAMVALARRHPEARVIYTGGSGDPLKQDLKEAPVVRGLMLDLGLDVTRMTFEDQSRTTWENAVYSRKLMQPRPGETWLLVTSALHMPRAVGAFRAVEWPVVPYPVNFTTFPGQPPLRLDPGGGLAPLGAIQHEWLGLLWYRLRGWSPAFFPGP